MNSRVDFSQIDWQQAWFKPFAQWGAIVQHVAQQGYRAWLAELNRVMRQHVQATSAALECIEFVADEPRHLNVPYELNVARTGQVWTRDGFHDFFNALIWLYFPKSKAAMNAMHVREINKTSQPTVKRGKMRDRLTLMDENGSLLLSSDEQILSALHTSDWLTLLFEQREKWASRCQLILFGHGLLEKLLQPFKACTAHVWSIPVASDFFQNPENVRQRWLDDYFAQKILNEYIHKFSPLPVLGVPGWCVHNQKLDFYLDRQVFRPRNGAMRK